MSGLSFQGTYTIDSNDYIADARRSKHAGAVVGVVQGQNHTVEIGPVPNHDKRSRRDLYRQHAGHSTILEQSTDRVGDGINQPGT